jgi:hypothetical protein
VLAVRAQIIDALIHFFGAAAPIRTFIVGIGEVETVDAIYAFTLRREARTGDSGKDPDVVGAVEELAVVVL